MNWLRALFAAGLSFLLPGAGHAVIGDWFRAISFAGLYVLSIYVFVSTEHLEAAEAAIETMDPATVLAAMETIGREMGGTGQFALTFVPLLAAVDVTFRALGFPPGSGGATTGESDGGSDCPHCGKPLDEDLEFCHWCTTRLEPEPTEDGAGRDATEEVSVSDRR
ncbi:zinc ribbon domain-containing protein [Natrialbaceae archaeon GCM10025810]|uniref:DUF7575 domain-containing protein n=1 Tax=Halovalidus salilacus TaxID=3075124 RepID=UPI003620DFCF